MVDQHFGARPPAARISLGFGGRRFSLPRCNGRQDWPKADVLVHCAEPAPASTSQPRLRPWSKATSSAADAFSVHASGDLGLSTKWKAGPHLPPAFHLHSPRPTLIGGRVIG